MYSGYICVHIIDTQYICRIYMYIDIYIYIYICLCLFLFLLSICISICLLEDTGIYVLYKMDITHICYVP